MSACSRLSSYLPLALGLGAALHTAHADPGPVLNGQTSAVAALQAQAADRARMAHLQWESDRRRADAHARMPDTMYASTPTRAPVELSCPVPRHDDTRRVLQGFTSADDLLGTPLSGLDTLASRDSGTVQSPPPSGVFGSSFDSGDDAAGAMTYGAWSPAFAASSSSTAPTHLVPLFPSASDAALQGFVRVINHSGESGDVEVEAIDDTGVSYGPLTLSISGDQTVHFNSDDLEAGNAGKGLTGSTGAGQGDWRLELTSELDIEVLSYIRTTDGFLTAMHDLAPVEDGVHRIAIFNPGSNTAQVSRLRLINAGDEGAQVTVEGTDDRGMSPGGAVRVTVAAGAAHTLTAAELESGATGLTGAIGDGAGKWRLAVRSEGAVHALSLLSSPTGHLTNLSTTPSNEVAGVHEVPLFPSASDASGRQGFVRVINHANETAEITITPRDETAWEYEPLTLTLAGGQVAHFNSDDLEQGNAGKGLTGSTGAGEGDWRLALSSDSDIEVLAYIRTTDGFLTAMHDVAPVADTRHRVAVFNPGSNTAQVSRLRLVNGGGEPAAVTIAGTDDRGASPGTDIQLVVPAGATRTYTAQELESGAEGFEGALGDGAGKWRLTVTSDRPIRALSLLSSPTGHLTNLSTAPGRGAGAATAEEVFATLISPIVQSQCANCHVEGGVSGNTRVVFVTDADADHLAKNLSVFETFVAEEEGADYILNKVQGVSHGGGIQLAAGSDGFSHMERFLRLLEGEDVDATAVTPANLFEGVRLESWASTLRRAAIVFAGRNPTAEEYASIRGASANEFRAALRGLMEGPEFHEFLIRGSNDRLLTDRERNVIIRGYFSPFVDYINEYHRLATLDDDRFGENVRRWDTAVQYGARRAPLELVAHIVENDLPYTDLLLADYVMANPQSAQAYGASTDFGESEDPHDFRPSKIEQYYRNCRGRMVEQTDLGFLVADPGPCATVFPHSGILNAKAFLQRYPTTATNRNRARSRWTYYHFLGVDVERSAARTTDPDALADTDNPTLRNPACTVCHTVLDPVAASYRDYGNEGRYLDSPGGLDALDATYKRDTPVRLDVSATSWEDRQVVSFVSGTVDAGTRDILLRSVQVFDATSRYLDTIVVHRLTLRAAAHEWEGVFELEAMEGYDRACGARFVSSNGDGGANVDIGGCVARVELPRAGKYTVDIHAYRDAAQRYACPIGGSGQCPPSEDGPDAQLGVHIEDFYRDGDRWYRGMLEPGLGTARSPDDADSLHWLAERMAEDPRFAESTVKFWWPAVMGAEVLDPPEDEGDAGFDALLIAAGAQNAEVGRLGAGFRRGFRGRSPYNLKDLLVEMVLSRWFRARSAAEPGALREAALVGTGARRLLTPEELARKTEALTGYRWGRRVNPFYGVAPDAVESDALTGTYRLMYGGIDSEAVTERARDMTSVMLAVAETHAVEASCPIVLREFYLLEDEERRLFRDIEVTVSPSTDEGADAIRRKLADLHETLMGVRVGVESEDVQAAWELFRDVWAGHDPGAGPRFLFNMQCAWRQDIRFFDGILDDASGVQTNTYVDANGEEREYDFYGFDNELVGEFLYEEVDPQDPEGIAAAWVAVLAFLMSDYRYLYL